jgi:uncharacterized membrane protein
VIDRAIERDRRSGTTSHQATNPKELAMQFLAILIPSTAIAWLFGRRNGGWPEHARRGLAAAMVVAGTSHFVRSEQFVQHLPGWVPAREALVFVTGAVEVALGAALLFSGAHRRAIGRVLAAYLVAVFPANIYVAVADVDVTGQAGGAMAWVRLPLQVLFIAWALGSTRSGRVENEHHVIDSSANPVRHLAA